MDKKRLSGAKQLAYIAVMCALLIGGQAVLSAVSGVEIVTVLLLCFAFCFGIKCGVLCAVAFSILRCLIWGFSPTVLIVYLIYYPLFTVIFGLLGKVKDEFYQNLNYVTLILINVVLLATIAACVYVAAFNVIKISRLYKTMITVLLYVIAGLFTLLLAVFNVFFVLKKRGKEYAYKILKLIIITAVAAVCTICFTLLDDVITPLIYGWTAEASLAYFYASFTAMLPQTVCAIVTVSLLFYQICAILNRL